MPVKHYYDMYRNEINAGDLINCIYNAYVERIYHEGDELGIQGSSMDGNREFYPLTTFYHEQLQPGVYCLKYFEIV